MMSIMMLVQILFTQNVKHEKKYLKKIFLNKRFQNSYLVLR